MIRWYADNSELHGIWNAEIPDILLFGGIAITEDARCELSSIIEDVKKSYKQEADFPLKWNFRSLHDYYKERGLEDLFKTLLERSKEWRTIIFHTASRVDFTIIISLILGHGKKRDVLIKTREALTRYVFSNALMRVGLHVLELNPKSTELYLDWPDGGQKKLFDEEFRSAYICGTTCGQQGYYCGPLKRLGFSESVFFASMNECSLLQFSDLVVGAAREVVEVALDKINDSLGLALIKQLKDKVRGAPNDVIGKGIIISPPRGDLYERVSQTIASLYDQKIT